MKLKGVFFQLTEEQIQQLSEEKEKTGCSMSAQVRMALTEYWRKREMIA